MYKHILVATDGSKLSSKAVTHAIDLAQALGAKLTAFYASPDYPLPAYADGVAYEPVSRKEYAALCKKEADKILGPLKLKAESAGLEFTAVHTISPSPWEAILATAKKQKCEAIVMASHGRRGITRLLLGSQATQVVTHSSAPVLICR